MWAWKFALAGLALLGHGVLWVDVANRLHSAGLPRWLVEVLTFVSRLCLLLIPAGCAWWVWHYPSLPAELPTSVGRLQPVDFYLLACAAIGLLHVPTWTWGRLHRRRPAVVRSERTKLVDLSSQSPVTGWPANWLARLPGNQLLRLEIREITLALPRLPEQLNGFSIVQLTDLHFCDRIQPPFFREIVRLANEMQPDLVAVTGDICDKRQCLNWIPETLGNLSSRLGNYFILGNHDLRVRDVTRLRRELAAAGLVDLGGAWKRLAVRESEIILAGNELPWFGPAADMSGPAPVGDQNRPLRILLSHTPDQWAWARRHDFDLMLAGHTHGGQICLPLVGPVFCHSRLGAHYASGTFHKGPTVLHVSRGVSSLVPLRFNCLPELTRIVLVRA